MHTFLFRVSKRMKEKNIESCWSDLKKVVMEALSLLSLHITGESWQDGRFVACVLVLFLERCWCEENQLHCLAYKMGFPVSVRVLCLHNPPFFLWLLWLIVWSHYLAQASLELVILLPQPPTCWDYMHWKPYLTHMNSYSCTERESLPNLLNTSISYSFCLSAFVLAPFFCSSFCPFSTFFSLFPHSLSFCISFFLPHSHTHTVSEASSDCILASST